MRHLLSFVCMFHLLFVLPEQFADDSQAAAGDMMPWAEKNREMFRESGANY